MRKRHNRHFAPHLGIFGPPSYFTANAFRAYWSNSITATFSILFFGFITFIGFMVMIKDDPETLVALFATIIITSLIVGGIILKARIQHPENFEKIKQEKEQAILDSIERIYISGGITGVDNFMEVFREEARYVEEMTGWEVINPAEICNALPATYTWEEYMDICIPLLKNCQAIYMLEGWENSRGAVIEHTYAIQNGKRVYYATDGF